MTLLENNITVEIESKEVTVDITLPEIIVEVDARQWPAWPWTTVESYSYYHIQTTSSVLWTIPHNLGFYPNVTIEDSAWDTVLPNKIEQDGVNQIKIHFQGAMSWKAYLS